MATTAVPPPDPLSAGLAELQRQQELITSCTALWKELTDHFSTLEQSIQARCDALRSANESLDAATNAALASLDRRELSIDSSVALASAKLDSALFAFKAAAEDSSIDLYGVAKRLRTHCAMMDAESFFDFLVSKKKEADLLRGELPSILSDCIDPPRFVMDAIARVFPVDKRTSKGNYDYGWACVLLLESLAPVLADPNPEIGDSRLMVTPSVRERAEEMVAEWKEGLEKRGGIEMVKPADVHTFLQHLVTFGIVEEEEKEEEFYRKLVVAFAWRKQMPRLAISLGLKEKMTEIIEELVEKGQQLDAISFAYETGLQDQFPPVPLLKSYLRESRKTPASIIEDRNNHGRPVSNATRREQSAIKAVIKCIEERKLEAEYPLEGLHKRLEQLEKTKAEKKKSSSSSPAAPATKRTRANSGGPMPPAKAGRLTTNAYISSFPVTSPYVHSPSHPTYPPAAAAGGYPYNNGPVGHNGCYGSRSPPSYFYPAEELSLSPPHLAVPSYPPSPINYSPYGAYNGGLAAAYQQNYYIRNVV